ncbi:MAG: flagellar biosynthetic protein FliP, partial [bacterium]|nr:flagellar biosynthetic protein FliP [bacterium]
VVGELRSAFAIGFAVYLPFLVIDLVVASVLMGLGMVMLSPTVVSLPVKLLLFVMVDGWALLAGSLVSSYR